MDRNFLHPFFEIPEQGQARKSLWIETNVSSSLFTIAVGQARKSLWIETPDISGRYVLSRSGS